MKKLTALLLAMLLVFSLVACGNNSEPTEPATEPPTEAPTAEPTEPVDVINSLSLLLQESADSQKSLSVIPNEDGTIYVQMYADVIKKANLDASAMETITIALNNSGLKTLDGQNVYGENQDIVCSMFVDCGDDVYVMADVIGEIPEAFATGYAAMEACIAELMADVPEYIPAPVVNGNIAENDMASLQAILDGMILENPESFVIENVATDDAEMFAYMTGLPTADGVATAVKFASQIMTSAYSVVIVTLEDGANAETVAKSFEDNIDWLKWVCVQPDSAAIATKDNQVLCLIGSADIFTQTVTAMDAAGWTPVSTLENPNLEG